MIWKWLKKLFKRKRKGTDRKIVWPTSEEIAALPEFEGLTPEDIVVVSSEAGARRAFEELSKEKAVGFDTESKPTFVKGEKSNGPHVIQFSTLKLAYVFMLNQPACKKIAGKLIELGTLKKVGFGLDDDLKRLRNNIKINPQSVLDAENLFGPLGYGRGVGVKVGVAIAFKRRFKKSKRAATSNWGSHHLTDHQLLYAANDAYAAIKVYRALSKSK